MYVAQRWSGGSWHLWRKRTGVELYRRVVCIAEHYEEVLNAVTWACIDKQFHAHMHQKHRAHFYTIPAVFCLCFLCFGQIRKYNIAERCNVPTSWLCSSILKAAVVRRKLCLTLVCMAEYYLVITASILLLIASLPSSHSLLPRNEECCLPRRGCYISWHLQASCLQNWLSPLLLNGQWINEVNPSQYLMQQWHKPATVG